MNNLLKRYTIVLSLFFIPLFLCADPENIRFEKYHPESHRKMVEQIFKQDKEFFLGNLSVQECLEMMKSSATVEVLTVNDKPVGFINAVHLYKHLFNVRFFKYGYINGLAIEKEHQNRGYGKLLLDHGTKKLQEESASFVMLRVHKNNAAARKLYEKKGFVQKEFDDSQDYILYKKELPISCDRFLIGNLMHRYPLACVALEAVAITGIVAHILHRALYSK